MMAIKAGFGMYGVVLWSDPNLGKAVIWSEDQGDLVYYEAKPSEIVADTMFIDTGDYVEFDVAIEANEQRAQNPKSLKSQEVTFLAAPALGCPKCRTPFDTKNGKTFDMAPVIPFSSSPAVGIVS